MMKFSAVALVLRAGALNLRRDPGVDLVAGGHTSCYTGTGEDYEGLEHQTENGEECLNWSKTETGGTLNFCRNQAGSGMSVPWCHPVNSPDAKVPCAVPECKKDGIWATNYTKKANETNKYIESDKCECPPPEPEPEKGAPALLQKKCECPPEEQKKTTEGKSH